MSCSTITPQYVSVCMIHSHDNGHMYLLLRRSAKYLEGIWQMIPGTIHPNEKASDAALREIRDKTGLAPDRLYCADAVKTVYMRNTDKVVFIPVFVAFIDQSDADVRLLLTEHDTFEWAAYDVALDRLMFAEQKRILTHIDKNFIQNDPNPIHLIH